MLATTCWGSWKTLSASPRLQLHRWIHACICMLCCSVFCDSLWSHGLWPIRLLCPQDFPDKNTGVDCHFLLQKMFPTQDQTHITCVPTLARWTLYHWTTWEAHTGGYMTSNDNLLSSFIKVKYPAQDEELLSRWVWNTNPAHPNTKTQTLNFRVRVTPSPPSPGSALHITYSIIQKKANKKPHSCEYSSTIQKTWWGHLLGHSTVSGHPTPAIFNFTGSSSVRHGLSFEPVKASSSSLGEPRSLPHRWTGSLH